MAVIIRSKTSVPKPEQETPKKPDGRKNNRLTVRGGGNATRPRDEFGLLEQERLFCEEYLVTLNATSAAILAGYSPKSAASTGSDLIRKPHIMAYLERAKRERLERLRIRQDEAIEELRLLVHSDIANYMRSGQRLTNVPSADPSVTRAVSKVKIKSKTYVDPEKGETTEHELEYALHSKTASLDMYMKHLGMFPATGRSLEIEDEDGNTLVIKEVIE